MTKEAVLELTREELYEKVWTTPSSRLCREFGFSDVALAKLCKKHYVPKPPLGYWAKLQNGHSVERLPLPKIQNDWLQTVRITIPNVERDGTDMLARLPIQITETIGNKIIVPESLDGLHHLAAQTLTTCLKSKLNSDGLLEPKEICLDIAVSPATLDRGIKLYSALIVTLEKLKYLTATTLDRGRIITCVHVDEQPVRLRLEEQLEMTTPERGRSPTGQLRFQIISDSRLGYRTKWQDTKAATLEKSLHTILYGVIRAAQAEKMERLKNEARDREWAEQERQRQEANNEADDLKRRTYDLLEKVDEWKKSKELNDYLDSLENAWIAKHHVIDSKSEFADWLAWARRFARELNPLPEIVEEGKPYDKERILPSGYEMHRYDSEAPKRNTWYPGKKWHS